MTEKEMEIFEMIEEGHSLNEMAYKLWISSKQLHQKIGKLKNDGYCINPLYYDNGDIKYKFEDEINKHSIKIELCDSSKFKALIVSDIHIGNELENLGYLYKVYDYARDNDIHTIFNCGDLIDGNFTRGNQTITNIDDQIQKVIKVYPYDKNILNYICFGNHDFSAYKNGRDIAVAVSSKRPDLINAGYGFSLINVQRDQFVIYHPLNGISFKPFPNKMILEGHHHKAMIKVDRNNYFINVPPLSDLCFGGQNNPGFLEMELLFGNGFIHSGFFKQVGIKKEMEVFGEFNIEFFLKHENLNEKKILLK